MAYFVVLQKMHRLILIITFIGIVLGAVPRHPHQNYKIIGGEPTDISKHPWQLSIEYEYVPYCSGFLISDSWAITAAHCDVFSGYTSIRAGSNITGAGGEYILIEDSIIHPEFNNIPFDNDIILLKLSKPFTTPHAKSALLPKQDEDIKDGALATLSGWGATEDGPSSQKLLQVHVPIVSHDVCQKAYQNKTITENMFCAGLLGVGGKDSCQGDSGGPVEIDGKIVGIVSWGHGCGEPDYPGVYTKLSNYIDWINNKTGLNL